VGVKSVSHETTFEQDTAHANVILDALNALCLDVQKETEAQNLLFKTVTLKIRFEHFETHTKSKTLPFLTNRLYDLQKTTREQLAPYLMKNRKVKLIGVRVSSLVSMEKQKTLI
jgi:nucleotidyltransferase/DNA polymerase involved in DNA repair